MSKTELTVLISLKSKQQLSPCVCVCVPVLFRDRFEKPEAYNAHYGFILCYHERIFLMHVSRLVVALAQVIIHPKAEGDGVGQVKPNIVQYALNTIVVCSNVQLLILSIIIYCSLLSIIFATLALKRLV